MKQKVEKINSRALFFKAFFIFCSISFSSNFQGHFNVYLINPNLQFWSRAVQALTESFLSAAERGEEYHVVEMGVVWVTLQNKGLIHLTWGSVLLSLVGPHYFVLAIVHQQHWGHGMASQSRRLRTTLFLLVTGGSGRCFCLGTSHSGNNRTRCQTSHQGIL